MFLSQKTKKTVAVIFISLAVMILPYIASAQAVIDYKSDPKHFSLQCIPNGNCTICDLFQLGLDVFAFLLGLLGAALFVVFVVGGWYYFIWGRGSSDKIQTGQDMIKNGFYGMMIVLVAWQIINLTIYILMGAEEKGKPYNFFNKDWNNINCVFGKPAVCEMVNGECIVPDKP